MNYQIRKFSYFLLLLRFRFPYFLSHLKVDRSYDPSMCEHSRRVLRRLQEQQGRLKIKAIKFESLVDKEVTKYKAKLEIGVAQCQMQIRWKKENTKQ